MPASGRPALRLIVLTALAACGLAVGLLPAHASGQAAGATDDRPVALTLSSADDSYATGRDIALAAAVTNTSARSCGIPAVAPGSLRIRSVTRDGVPLTPVAGQALLLAGVDVGVAAAAVPSDPGVTLAVPIDVRDGADGSSSAWLQQFDTLPTGEAITSSWDLATPGRYEVAALWAPPGTVNDPVVRAASGNPDSDPEVCVGPSRLALVSFTVTGASASLAWWWWLLLALAPVAVAVLIVVIARRRSTAAATVVFLLASTATLLGPSPSARADISGVGDVSGAVSGCLAQFAQPGMDPAGTVAALTQPGAPPVRVEQVSVPDNGLGTQTDRVDPADPNQGTVISWDPTHDIHLDGAVFPPCLALYHELTHAVDMAEGIDSTEGECGGVPISDLHTVAAENLLRPKLGLGPRTQYHGVPIPPITHEQCKEELKKKREAEFEPPLGPDGDGGLPPGGTGNGSGPGGHGSGGGSSGGNGSGGGDGSGGNGSSSTGGGRNGGGDLGGGNGGGGSIFADPHLATLDGLLYDLQLVGEFVALRLPDGREVQIRTTPVAGSEIASMVSAVAVRAGSSRIGFYADDGDLAIRLDGAALRPTDAPIDLGGVVLQRVPATAAFSGFGYRLTWPDGTEIELQNSAGWALQLLLRIGADQQGRPVGLLGNADGDPADDLVTRDGTPVPDPAASTVASLHAFGDTWRLQDQESLFDYNAGQSTASFTDPSFPRPTPEPTPAQLQNAQYACNLAGVRREPLRSTCLFDVLAGGQPGLVVQSAAVGAQFPTLVGPGSPGVTEPTSAPHTDTAPTSGPSGAIPEPTVENGLQEGGSISGTVTPDAPVRLEFEGAAGQIAYFRATGDCDPADTSVIWTVRAVSGRLDEYHGTVGACQDVGRAGFGIDGTYALEFTGDGPYAFTWDRVEPDLTRDLPADGVGQGELSAPTARHTWWFQAETDRPVSFTPDEGCPAGSGATWYVLDKGNNFNGGGVYDLCQAIGPLDLPTGRYQLVLLSTRTAVPYRFTTTQ